MFGYFHGYLVNNKVTKIKHLFKGLGGNYPLKITPSDTVLSLIKTYTAIDNIKIITYSYHTQPCLQGALNVRTALKLFRFRD